MLPRPGLLLNPWETRSTSLTELEMSAGQAASSTAGGRDGALRKARAESAPGGGRGAQPVTHDGNLDFLALTAPTHYNLVPDNTGVVRIPRKDLRPPGRANLCRRSGTRRLAESAPASYGHPVP
ncbi:hypothetical protein [Verrucomicrobium spinosum]|uniref:hypothetical protein n=1 Tax=Verrucomicrobium spinosum TaxID=2736 RepID=UPI0012E3006B|nr:hypothetical protein [Verrucomicrobium spinosum]